MAKILGLDLGTNSIGAAVRNTDNGGRDLKDQLDYFTVNIFPSGVGTGKSGEFSYAAERTEHRTTRHTLRSRKQRIWATLALLIEKECTPLTLEQLDRWRKYDKAKGLTRQYPVDAKEFEQWVHLDFDGDGQADYTSPYQLRAELMEKQLDWNNETDRMKLGRALYHIAQRRGFKSSKGETLKDMEEDAATEADLAEEMKKSEIKKSKDISEYMEEHGLQTVGQAFARLEKEGIRIRENTTYQAVRSQYKDEIIKIFSFQEALRDQQDFLKRLTSEKKHEGTIFYKKPLKSQKGNVAKCLLEPQNPRCPISHPEFEKFRALSLLNNVKYRKDETSEWQTLSPELRQGLLDEKFMRTQKTFKFEEITKWLSKQLNVELYNDNQHKGKTINYRNYTSVSGCPISARLRKILGDNWQTCVIENSTERENRKTGEKHNKQYNYESVWNLCFSTDEVEDVERIARDAIGLDDTKAKEMTRLWSAIQEGYANLSLKAIRKINSMLEQGFRYDEAVLFAKLPDILGSEWQNNASKVIQNIRQAKDDADKERFAYQMVNTLIAKWKNLPDNEKVGYRNVNYTIDEDDCRDVNMVVESMMNDLKLNANDKAWYEEKVKFLYQEWFKDYKRTFLSARKSSDIIKDILSSEYPDVSPKKWESLYHHSMFDIYPAAKADEKGVKHLGSPVVSAIKNPMAMRILHTLRRLINSLIDQSIIDEDTHIVVEMAREVNDQNWRDAINDYQRAHETENRFFEDLINEKCERDANKSDIDKCRLLMEQGEAEATAEKQDDKKLKQRDREWRQTQNLEKYKLWKEQNFRSIYTGKTIKLTDLFDANKYDIEHTVPRSISFDNSMANKTVCEADFNRNTKKNQLPSQLSNYQEILTRIEPWKKKLDRIESNIQFWKEKSKRASTKDDKDKSIRQRHLWELERDYWKAKVCAFEVTEYNDAWRNNQLNDTRIISKYALHYLKTLFEHVDVANGKYTSDFRKMLGVQSLDEKKDREKHSHHAIDATILTLMPSSQKRKTMLELFYRQEELKGNVQQGTENKLLNVTKDLDRLIETLDCGKVDGLREFIESNILINHIHRDQTLTPTSRRWRVRGKIVPLRDEQGNIVREANGMPKAKRWIKGDIIRGQLHKDTFFGAINYPTTDANGLPMKENGGFVYGKEDDVTMAVRVTIKNQKDDKFVNAIIDPQVRKRIRAVLDERTTNGISIKEALQQDIWLTDRDGNEIRHDKNGRPLSPLRHVRCKIFVGRGFMTRKTSLTIKRQTYKSEKRLVNLENRDYKQYMYAQNADNYLFLLYEATVKGAIKRKSRLVNLFTVAELKIKNLNDLLSEPYYQTIKDDKDKAEYKLCAVIQRGTRVLLKKSEDEDLSALNHKQLIRRLYIVNKFNTTGSDLLYLKNHLEARRDNETKKEEYTTFDANNYQARLTLVAQNCNILVEGKDFNIDISGNLLFT